MAQALHMFDAAPSPLWGGMGGMANSMIEQGERVRGAPPPSCARPDGQAPLPPPSRGRRRRGHALVPHPAPGHDLRDPLRVAGAEIPPAFEDFEHIFVVSQPDEGSTLGAELCDVERRVEGILLRIPPLEIAANAIPAPRRHITVIIIKRRAAVGEERGGYAGSVEEDEHVSMKGCAVTLSLLECECNRPTTIGEIPFNPLARA